MDIFSKHAWVVLLKNRKEITINNAFQKLLSESNRKSNKICVDKGSQFYNRSMKSRLQYNGIEIYSTRNKGESIVAERSIKTLKKSANI